MKQIPIYAICAAGWVAWMAFFFGVPVGMIIWLMSMTNLFDYPTHALFTMLGGFMFMAAWAGAMAGIGKYVAEHYSEEAAFLLFLYHERRYPEPPAPPPIPDGTVQERRAT